MLDPARVNRSVHFIADADVGFFGAVFGNFAFGMWNTTCVMSAGFSFATARMPFAVS
jgi:hypothetical protein